MDMRTIADRWLVCIFVLLVTGCNSMVYHAREMAGGAHPCLYAGTRYCISRIESASSNFVEKFIDGGPMILLAPAFLGAEFVVDSVLLPFDGIGIMLDSDDDKISINTEGRVVMNDMRQVLCDEDVLKYTRTVRISVECGEVRVNCYECNASSLDYYLPLVRMFFIRCNDGDGRGRDGAVVFSGQVDIRFSPPRYDGWTNNRLWYIEFPSGVGDKKFRFRDIELSDDFKGFIGLLNKEAMK